MFLILYSADNLRCLHEVLGEMESSVHWILISFGPEDSVDHDTFRGATKVARSFERFRRTATKLLETPSPDLTSCLEAVNLDVRTMVLKSVEVLEKVLLSVSLLTAVCARLNTELSPESD